jgi:hypothetical protein
MMAVSTAVTAAGQLQSGLYASRVASNQALVARENAKLAHEGGNDLVVQGQEQQRRLGRDIAQKVGAQEARMGANNIDPTFGSAARTIADTKMIGAEDQATLNENINRQVRAQQIDAWNFENESRAAQSEASQAKTAGIFGAATTVLGAVTQYAKFKAGAKVGSK